MSLPDGAELWQLALCWGELLKMRAAQLEAVLRAVESWSIDTATDLTDAGYSWWAELLHGPRQPLSREAALEILREIEAALGRPIGPVN
jgi:hypothetical protein